MYENSAKLGQASSIARSSETSELENLICMLENLAVRLDTTVDTLEGRLFPILRQSSPPGTVGPEKNMRAPQSPMGTRIAEVVERVDVYTNRLRDISERICA